MEGGSITAAVEEGSSGTVVLIICGGIGGVVILGLLGLLVSVCIRLYPSIRVRPRPSASAHLCPKDSI